jgi:hypothetical protein
MGVTKHKEIRIRDDHQQSLKGRNEKKRENLGENVGGV